MTIFGKILVVMNFALSIMALMWAMMFYFNRIDWTEDMKPRKARVDELWSAMRPADVAYRDAHAELLAQESYRAADRPWYVAEIQRARSGATEMDPARTVVYDKGVLVLVPANPAQPKHLRPKMDPATVVLGEAGVKNVKKLASLDSYQDIEVKTRAELIKAQDQLVDRVKENQRLTDLLTPPEGKGLRQRIEDEKVKIKLANEEHDIVKPLLVNTAIESELILRRTTMLEARITELKNALGVAAREK